MKPTNEALRAWAQEQARDISDKWEVGISVPDYGVVQITERVAFVEAIIAVPLTEDGEIAG